MKATSPRIHPLATALLAALLLPATLLAQTATTDPVGFITLNIAGNGGTSPAGFTFASLGLMNSVAYQGTADTVGANALAVTTAPFMASQYNANGSNPTYFVEIVTPTGAASQAPGAGTTYDILSNTTTAITLMQNLAAGVVNGAQFRIRQHWSVGGAFGVTNNKVVDPATSQVVGLGSGNSTNADQILRWNGAGYDIFYYQTSGFGGVGWRKAGAPTVDASGSALYPEDAMIINRLQSSPLSLVLLGAVKTGQTSIPVTPGTNFVGNVYPVSLTLSSCAIYTGNSATGLAGGNSSGADQILIWNASLGGGTGGYDIYYYQTSGFGGTGWRKSGAPTLDAGPTVIPISQAIIINRQATGSFNWVIPQPAMNL